MQRRGATLAIALAISLAAAAEDLTDDFALLHPDAVVDKVVFLGNERTRDGAMRELVGIEAGTRLSQVDVKEIEQRVLRSGLFSEVELSCELDGEEAIVLVSVREKWTFIPLPSASVGTDEWSAGLAVLEYNFLGLRDTLALSGSVSSLGPSGMLAFIDPRLGGSPVSFRFFASTGRSSVSAEYPDGAEFASYVETSADCGLSLEYPSESPLKGEANLTARYSGVGAGDAAAYALYEEAVAIEAGAGLSFDGRRMTGYYEAGPYARASYLRGFSIEGPRSYDALDAEASWQGGFALDGYWGVGAVAGYSGRPLQCRSSLSGLGYRVLSQSASLAKEAAAGYAFLEIPFLRPSWCVMTLGAFYEGGACLIGLEGAERASVFHGPGASYRLYLKNVAIPALGVDVAYDVPDASLRGGLFLGLSLD